MKKYAWLLPIGFVIVVVLTLFFGARVLWNSRDPVQAQAHMRLIEQNEARAEVEDIVSRLRYFKDARMPGHEVCFAESYYSKTPGICLGMASVPCEQAPPGKLIVVK